MLFIKFSSVSPKKNKTGLASSWTLRMGRGEVKRVKRGTRNEEGVEEGGPNQRKNVEVK